MDKVLCRCGKMATWLYMPGHSDEDNFHCDDCVPRGCSCTTDPNDPCCEYDYSEEGYDKEEIENG